MLFDLIQIGEPFVLNAFQFNTKNGLYEMLFDLIEMEIECITCFRLNKLKKMGVNVHTNISSRKIKPSVQLNAHCQRRPVYRLSSEEI